MRIALDTLSRFAFSMATCLGSGLGPGKSLALSAAAGSSKPLAKAAAAAGDACQHGVTVSDGLEPYARWFPRFFVPVIRAGEVTGRFVEAWQLIHQHCERLGPALKSLRNAWLYPAICIATGWAVRAALFLFFGLYSFAGQFVRDTFMNSLLVLLVAWTLLQVPPIRLAVDYLILQLPLFRETLLTLAVVLFFSTFRLAYEAGGLNVLAIFDLALATVPNAAIRKDFLRAREVLNQGGTFEEAFAQPNLLDNSIKSSIAAGALSGHLGRSLEQVTNSQTVELEVMLAKFNAIFHRLVGYGVAMSIVGTLLMCLAYGRKF